MTFHENRLASSTVHDDHQKGTSLSP